ncbi:MAG: hypothetical protein KGI98_04700 [Euryarchaeota archaeon]|nr:hypothetical protein [Euryarchaeota archaeon]MDE1880642.1 hypothetical protein [Euryarchaeota archaeon]
MRSPVPSTEDSRMLLLHPTSSLRSALLEEQGFDPVARPYRPKEDVARLLEIYEELQYDGELKGVTPRAVLMEAQDRPELEGAFQWFTPYYFTARNRAIAFPFGETARALLQATEELAHLLSDPGRRDAHRQLLKEWDDRERERVGRPLAPGEQESALVTSMQQRELALNAIVDPKYIAESLRKVMSLREEFLSRWKGGSPVVYAVRVAPEDRILPGWETTDGPSFRLREALPPSSLIYRIDLGPEAQEVPGADPELLGELSPPAQVR